MAGMRDVEKWSMDKLDGSNWITWKFQMRHLLRAKRLWGYVEGTEVLANDAGAQARADFEQRSEKAFSTIIMGISTPQLYLVTSCDQPKEAWDSLRNHFERETLANKLYLKKRYFRAEMKEGTSIEMHLKDMKEITDRLAAIGAPIAEEDQVVTLLGSLPESYSTLVTALEARVDDVQLNFVQQALIHEEQKWNGQFRHSTRTSSGGQVDDSALFGQQKKGKPRKTVTCFGCGEIGHFRSECVKMRVKGSGPAHKAKAAKEKCSDSDSDGAFVGSVGSVQPPKMGKWLVDSGASRHMTREKEQLTNYREFDKPEKVGLGDGRTVEAEGVGSVCVNMLFKVSDPKQSVLHHVLYVPKLACNLFSVRAAAVKGNIVQFGHSRCWIRDGNGKLHGMGSLVDKLYQLDCEPVSMENVSVASEQTNEIDLWHQRLGHINGQQLKEVVQKDVVIGIKIPKAANLSFCEGCVEGKMHRKPFKPVGEIRSTRKLQLVHSDVCGPMHTESIGGRKYFVTFIDDFSRCCAVYFLRHKSEVLEKFKEFEAITTNESGQRIGTLRTDNGGEYVSREFEAYLKSKGIHHQLSVAHSPEQNGVVERRMNRTLVESARSMIAHAGLPNNYWAEAVATAAYLRSRTPTTAFKEKATPYKQWYRRKPKVSHLRVFGCMAYAHIPDVKRQKLHKKAEKLRFVGYSKKSKGYRLFNEDTRKNVTRRDVIFNETDFGHSGIKAETEAITPKEIVEVDPNPDRACRPEVENRRSERQRNAPVRYGFDEYADTVISEHHVHHVAYNVCQITEPRTMEEALASKQSKEWKAAADSEYESLMENETWELMELPHGRKPVGCKWVFQVKCRTDGRVERFKGRLVAKGYVLKYGIDYDETFSPVVRLRFDPGTAGLCSAERHDYPSNGCCDSISKWKTG